MSYQAAPGWRPRGWSGTSLAALSHRFTGEDLQRLARRERCEALYAELDTRARADIDELRGSVSLAELEAHLNDLLAETHSRRRQLARQRRRQRLTPELRRSTGDMHIHVPPGQKVEYLNDGRMKIGDGQVLDLRGFRTWQEVR